MNLRTLALILLISGCHGQAKPVPAPVAAVADQAQGRAAYDAKDWPRCVTIFTAIAQTTRGRANRDALYSVASCHALAGTIDPAFAALTPATSTMTEAEVQQVEQDADLVALHADPRWPRLIAAARQRLAIWEASLGDRVLRRELLAMSEKDQEVREGDFTDKAVLARARALAVKHNARMKEIVGKVGWPGANLVGKDGANAAWLLVQHADQDVAFQTLCLSMMEPLVKTGEVSAIDYAYLWDRVAVADKRPQRWGTQFANHRLPAPMEDPANVDARRAAIGLSTMAEYEELVYGPK